MSLTNKAFTLVELMVVLCIMGAVAAFALPQYTQSVERSHRKDAENQLALIYSAQQMYASRNNNLYWGPAVGGTSALRLASINQNLSLNILANGMDYDCAVAGGGATYACTAARIGGAAFTITMTQNAVYPGTNPGCLPSSVCP